MRFVLLLLLIFYLDLFVLGQYLQIIRIPLHLNFLVGGYSHLVLIYYLCLDVQVLIVIQRL